MPLRFLLTLLLFPLLSAPLPAFALDYDESIFGDLSDDPDAPTLVVLDLGANTLRGTLDGSMDVRDYVTFSLVAGQSLLSLRQLEYVDGDIPAIPANRGFHAIIEGSTSFVPSLDTADSFLGGAHLDTLPVGTDMLPILAAAPEAGMGFDVPLGPGTYTYHLQQTSPNATRYGLELLVVPEPTSAMLILGGLVVLARRRPRVDFSQR